MQLPPALQPWHSLLSLLPHDVALGLGPSILRLALAVGPLRTRARRGEGEPDGFDGLGRRGTYDRLVLSDWLLASEAPMEFLRRAAVGELAFLELARREPARSLTAMAVFDAGPDQLGVPRVVQVAALLVLAQRAEAAGASFRWGVVQAADRDVLPCTAASHVMALVESRTPAPPRAEHVAAWHARARADGCEELWVVGSRAVTAEADRLGDGWLSIEQVVDPEQRAAEVSARAPRKGRTDARLELPEERLCARVLRDPLDTAVARPSPFASSRRPVSNLLFSTNGRKVFARTHSGGLVGFPVPNSPRAGAGRPKLYFDTLGRTLVAAAWHRRSAVAATFEAGKLSMHRGGTRMSRLVQQTVSLEGVAPGFVAPARERLLPVAFLAFESEIVPLVLDAGGTLYEIGFAFDPPAVAIAEDVRALAPRLHGEGVVFVGRGHTAHDAPDPVAPYKTAHPPLLLPESRWSIVAMTGVVGRPPAVLHLEGDGSFEAFCGWGASSTHPSFGLIAVQQRGHAWTIHSRHAPLELHPDPASRVVGVTVDLRADAAGAPSLVVLDSGGHRLSLVGRRSSRALSPSVERIVHVTASHAGPEIAYVTESGSVVVLGTEDTPLVHHVAEASG